MSEGTRREGGCSSRPPLPAGRTRVERHAGESTRRKALRSEGLSCTRMQIAASDVRKKPRDRSS